MTTEDLVPKGSKTIKHCQNRPVVILSRRSNLFVSHLFQKTKRTVGVRFNQKPFNLNKNTNKGVQNSAQTQFLLDFKNPALHAFFNIASIVVGGQRPTVSCSLLVAGLKLKRAWAQRGAVGRGSPGAALPASPSPRGRKKRQPEKEHALRCMG